MQNTQPQQEVLYQLTQWVKHQDSVRAMLLTSTRANPHAQVDVFSDYDVILVVQDIRPFFENRVWVQDFGQVLVSYWDPIRLMPDHKMEQVTNVIYYKDGLRIDFTVWPEVLMKRIAKAPTLPAGLDVGYHILMDKDHLTDGLQAPTYTAYIPKPPTESAYQTWVEEFFCDAPHVAKCLWRDELMPAKWGLDANLKDKYLRQMLEWRISIDHKWSLPMGKGLKKHLPPTLWSQLESTYVGAEIEENWGALFKTMILFRQVAIEVAESLGYVYPHHLDQQVTEYVQSMKQVHKEIEPPTA